MGTFPRDIVISPGYGAGIATWNDKGYEAVENPAFVEYVRSGGSDEIEAHRILVEEGILASDDEYFYLGGLDQAVVVTVNGPYLIDEYDGFESVTTQEETEWRQ